MTKFEKYATIFIVVCLTIVAAGLACKFANRRGYNTGWKDALASIKPDTTWHTDTMYIDRPVPTEIKPAGQEFYPVGTIAALRKTLDSLASVKPDTTFIEIPIPTETKLYRDSTYEAQVSGYNPSLDYIKVYPKTAYITKPVPEYKYPSFVVSPIVSISASPVAVDFAAGLDVSFWKGRWAFSIEGGYGYFMSKAGNTPGPYASGKVCFNLIRR